MEEPEKRKQDNGADEQKREEGDRPAEAEYLHQLRHHPAEKALAALLFHIDGFKDQLLVRRNLPRYATAPAMGRNAAATPPLRRCFLIGAGCR